MNQLKQNIIVFPLIVLLFVLVLIPPALMEYNSSRRLNEITLYSVKTANLEGVQSADPVKLERSIQDRIEQINNSVAQVQTTGYIDLQQNKALRLTLEEQLMLLQDFDALPKFSLSEFVSATYSQRTYMDPEKPDLAVSVWVINAKYDGVFVYACMDVETSAIYEMFINTDQGQSFENGSEDPKEGFFKYLNTFGADEDFTKESLSVSCFFDKDKPDKVYFNLTSANMQTNDYDYVKGDTLIEVYAPN